MKNKVIIFDFLGTLVRMRPPTLLTRKSLLEALAKKYILATVTSAKRTETKNILKKLEIEKLFQLVLTKDDLSWRKPDKRIYEFLKKNLNTKAAVYIGDSLKDYQFAQNSKIPFMFVGKKKIGIKSNKDVDCLLDCLLIEFPGKIEEEK